MAREVNFGKMLHGGDYNPEQWLHSPEILEKDIEYFKKAKIPGYIFLGSTRTGRGRVPF